MKSEIIAVGDEVVKGYTMNTNASYLAKCAEGLGMHMKYHTAVCDAPEDLTEVLACALKRSDVIFITGGLGPTDDDLTKETVCHYLKKPLVFEEALYREIIGYFKRIGKETPDNNRKQACFPTDAYILDNICGTAPGCILEAEGKYVILLPGPPKEMMPMVEQKVIPYFERRLKEVIRTLDIKVFGIGESQLAEKLGKRLGVFSQHSVATYVGNQEIIVRIRAYGEDEEAVQKQIEMIKIDISECLVEYIIGYNNKQLVEQVLEQLKAHQATLAVAESCTGGLLAGTLINCSGISAYMNESIITYSNEAKSKYLGVKEATLKQHGAVSHETACEMALGVCKQAGATIGLATTGIAGPEGGTPTKPVGTVYVGVAIRDTVESFHLQLSGTRQEIRQKAVKHALFLLYKKLTKDNTCI